MKGRSCCMLNNCTSFSQVSGLSIWAFIYDGCKKITAWKLCSRYAAFLSRRMLPQMVASTVKTWCTWDLSKTEVLCHAAHWEHVTGLELSFTPNETSFMLRWPARTCPVIWSKNSGFLCSQTFIPILVCLCELKPRKPCAASMPLCRSWQPDAAKRLHLFVFPSPHLSVCWVAKEMQLHADFLLCLILCACAHFLVCGCPCIRTTPSFCSVLLRCKFG